METAPEEAPKRALDEADDGYGMKRLKTDHETYQFLSTVENIKTVNDPKKWNLLPSIVYDLLSLLKKTEKLKSVEEKRAEEIKDESNRKTSVVKEQHTSTNNAYHLPVSTNNFPCTDPFTNDVSKTVISTESISNVATSTNSIYNTPFLASGTSISNTLNISTNSISNTAIHSSKNINTIIVSENSTQQVIFIKKKNFREQMFEILNKNCFNSISEIPLTKPSLCTCKGCTFVTSLQIKQSAVYSLLFTSNDLKFSNVPDAGSSISPKNDCYLNQSNTPCIYQKTLTHKDSPKNIWISHLTSLINKKDSSSKKYHHTTNKIDASKKLNSVQNVINKVHKITQNINSNFPFCNKCKGSKLNKYDRCKCSVALSRSYRKYK